MKQKFLQWLRSPMKLNYVFFACTFGYLTILSLALIGQASDSFATSAYFSLYATLQAFIEVLCFIMIGLWIRSFLPKWLYIFYTGFLFLCLLAHLMNYILIRLIDTTISYVRDLFFSEDFDHFVTSIRALDMNPAFLAFMAIIILSIPWIGVLLYKLGSYFSEKKHLTITVAKCFKMLIATTIALVGLDLAVHPKLSFNQYLKFEKFLPVSSTFYAPKGPTLKLKAPLKHLPAEHKLNEQIAGFTHTASEMPNIYLFITETFRADCVTEVIAPNLKKFSQENISFDRAISGANSSHTAWYCILHSNFPHQWKEAKETWEHGSVPLRLLKKLGYKTHVVASTDIKYFHMKETLFGKDAQLIDDYLDLADDLTMTPDERDFSAVEYVEKSLQSPDQKRGQLFIVFLDSPHSNYNWPEEASVFEPTVDELNYFELISTRTTLEHVKNRYKNAIHYIDTLFGKFRNALEENQLYDDSIVVFTGDHAEEFFEDGAIFHATHLNEYQTHIPLFYRFPTKNPLAIPSKKLGTQIDIFPSILHYLTKQDHSNFFDGEPIFSQNKWPFTITAMHNGNATPFQFYLHNGEEFLEIRSDLYDPFASQLFEIISYSNSKTDNRKPERFAHDIFGTAFEKLTRDFE